MLLDKYVHLKDALGTQVGTHYSTKNVIFEDF